MKNYKKSIYQEKKKMKMTTIWLIVTGLLVAAITGIAFAMAGDNGADEADAPDEAPNGGIIEVETDHDDLYLDKEANFGTDDMDESQDFDINALIPDYFSITGKIESVEVIGDIIRVTIEDTYGNPAVLVLTKDTVFPFENEFDIGDTVTGWYVTDAPMIMIWPPEYNIAVLAVGAPEDSNIKVDRFNTWADSEEGLMISQDEMFAFQADKDTVIILANGDDFSGGDIEGRRIVVIYDISTRSIPEMATANMLIVLYCPATR